MGHKTMTTLHDDAALALFLEQGKTASAQIEINLLAALPFEGVVGVTTTNTILSWQGVEKQHRYRAMGIPVRMVESNEDVVMLTSRGKNPQMGLRFILYIRNESTLVTPPNANRLKPHHLKIEVPRFEVGGDGYIGQIESAELIYETTGDSLIGFFQK